MPLDSIPISQVPVVVVVNLLATGVVTIVLFAMLALAGRRTRDVLLRIVRTACPLGRTVGENISAVADVAKTSGISERTSGFTARSEAGKFATAARLRSLVPLFVGFTALAMTALPRVAVGPPTPSMHDEFANLLAADTFAHGRLTNETHPYWEHFETIHVLSHPTYQAKYPPGQGLLLAVGKLLGSGPWLGVWLSTGAAAAAVCWMLLGWLPIRWALVGGLICALHPGVTLLWSATYAGGQLPLIGGALLLGSVKRLTVRPAAGMAATMAASLALLANTRPAEGLLLSIPALGYLAVSFYKQTPFPTRLLLTRVLLPALGILTPCAAMMAYYDWCVTGHILRMPYQEHTAQYMAAPIFFWESPHAKPVYCNSQLEAFYAGWELDQYTSQASIAGWIKGRAKRGVRAFMFYWPPMFLPALIVLPAAGRSSTLHPAIACLASLSVIFTGWVWLWPHYLAPFTCLVILVLTVALRRLWLLSAGRFAIGKYCSTGCMIVYLFFVGMSLLESVQPPNPTHWSQERLALLQELEATPAQDLVFVKYDRGHNPHHEWIYNDADIDSASVVWARSLSAEQDRALVAYFAERNVWVLEADKAPVPSVNPALLQHQETTATFWNAN